MGNKGPACHANRKASGQGLMYFMKLIDKLIHYGFYLFVFLLPWQTRWIFNDASLNGGIWEYGRMSLYGTEILLIILLILGLINWSKSYFKKTKEQKLEEVKSELKGQKFLIILLIIWSGLTIFWSGDKLLAWFGLLNLIWGIGIFWLIESQGIEFKKVGYALIFSGAIQSFLGIWQFLNQGFFASKWLGISALNPATLGTSVIDNGVGRFLRAYGSLPHPNMLAGFLVIGILTAIILINREPAKKIRNLLNVAVGFLALGLILTFSRAGWLALILSLIIFIIYNYIKKQEQKKIIWPLIIIGLIFLIIFFSYGDLFKSRLTGLERLELKSNQERASYYPQAFSIIKAKWLKGVGLGNYTLVQYQKNPTLNSWDYQPIHDTALLTWAEMGIIGLMLFIGIIIFAFKNRGIYWPLLVAILVLGFFDHYFHSLYFGIMLWWLVVGINRKNEQAT